MQEAIQDLAITGGGGGTKHGARPGPNAEGLDHVAPILLELADAALARGDIRAGVRLERLARVVGSVVGSAVGVTSARLADAYIRGYDDGFDDDSYSCGAPGDL